MKNKPVEVTAIAALTADGVTNIVHVNRFAYYNLIGQKY